MVYCARLVAALPEKGSPRMDALLGALDRQINLVVVLWAFPLAFLIHDLEEIFTMERFVREHREQFPKWMRVFAAMNTRQMVISVTVLLALILVASFLAASLNVMDPFII